MGRRYSHRSVPVRASSASTMFPGLAMYITPSWTIGVVCDVPGSRAQDHTSCSDPMLLRVIWLSGLNPHPSSVRRQLIQSEGGGLAIIASVTGETCAGVTVTRSAPAGVRGVGYCTPDVTGAPVPLAGPASDF